MIKYNNKKVGIIQYKKIDKETYDLDLFIGDLYFHNKNIGKEVIKLMTNYLINKKGAKTCILCPLKENIKAIKCYEKAGYKIIKEYKDYNTINELKDYVLMKYGD